MFVGRKENLTMYDFNAYEYWDDVSLALPGQTKRGKTKSRWVPPPPGQSESFVAETLFEYNAGVRAYLWGVIEKWYE